MADFSEEKKILKVPLTAPVVILTASTVVVNPCVPTKNIFSDVLPCEFEL